MVPEEQRHAVAPSLDPWRRGPMTIGVLLDAMFRLSRRTWRPFTLAVAPIALTTFLIVNLLNNAPSRALQSRLQSGHVSPTQLVTSSFLIPFVDGTFYLGFLGSVLMLGAGLWVIGCGERAEVARPSAALGMALHRLRPLLAVTLLIDIAVGLGLVLAIIPGIVLTIFFALAPAAVVLERMGPFRAIARSWRLIASHFWRSLGVLALGILVITVIGIALGLVVGAILGLLASSLGTFGSPIAGALTQTLLYVVLGSLGASLIVLLYADLRNRSEGFDLTLPSGGGPNGPSPSWNGPPGW